MQLPKFEYSSPTSINQAITMLLDYGKEARVIAGGTDLLVKMKQRAIKPLPKFIINIKGLTEMNSLTYSEEEGLHIGALTKIHEIKSFLPVQRSFVGLFQAAGLLSTPQVRNIATIGGNLCNASPAADMAPALLTLEAKAKIRSESGDRVIPLSDFFVGPSLSALEHGELLTELMVPNPSPTSTGVYLKQGKRLSDVAVAGVAITMDMDKDVCRDIKIAFASVGPIPMRAPKTEALIKGRKIDDKLLNEAGKSASEECQPMDDIRGKKDERRNIIGSLLKDAIAQAALYIKLGGS
jgi:CO/xanthine dehydrogenase FAD-binding subunit